MYASRFAAGPRFRPASMGVALAINGGVVAALLLVAPEIIPERPRPPTTFVSIPIDQPKPEPTKLPVTPRTTTRSAERPDVKPPLPLPDDGQFVRVDPVPPIGEIGPDPVATGTSIPIELPFRIAVIDPRYASDFQPDYPDTARDAGREGVVRLRVLIGVDGRVKKIERISGDDAFWRAASRHALGRWRFRPATRGDVPEESWQTMTVRFVLD